MIFFQLGSPKEMCLALLEEMDSLSNSGKTAAMLNMLSPLQKGILVHLLTLITIHPFFSSSESS